MNKIFGLIISSLLASEGLASTIDGANITKVLVGPTFQSIAFISVNVQPTGKPTCSTNGNYTYVFDHTTDTGKAVLSTALSAYTSKSSVKVGGYDKCEMYNNVEDLKYIQLQ